MGENLEEREKKRNCPFDAKKVCPVTPNKAINPRGAIHGDFCVSIEICSENRYNEIER